MVFYLGKMLILNHFMAIMVRFLSMVFLAESLRGPC